VRASRKEVDALLSGFRGPDKLRCDAADSVARPNFSVELGSSSAGERIAPRGKKTHGIEQIVGAYEADWGSGADGSVRRGRTEKRGVGKGREVGGRWSVGGLSKVGKRREERADVRWEAALDL
jgi:hypothetical protein